MFDKHQQLRKICFCVAPHMVRSTTTLDHAHHRLILLAYLATELFVNMGETNSHNSPSPVRHRLAR